MLTRLVFLSAMALSFSAPAAAPAKSSAKATSKEMGAAQSKTSADTQPPLHNAKAKKKKLLRPGIEWEPAPAPLKW